MITGDVWGKINTKYLPKKGVRKAVIAYVTKKSKILRKGDSLICDASKQAIRYRKTCAKTLEYYYEKGVQIKSFENLHSKFLYTDNQLVIGSANLSKNSAERLTESAIVVTNKNEISNAKAFFYKLTKEAKEVDEDYLHEILKIKVVSNESVNNKKSESRNIEFGKSIWVVGVTPLSDKIYENEFKQIELAKNKVSEIHDIDEEDISFIRFTGSKKIRKNSKVGDLVIEISSNKKKTKSVVREASPILEVEQQSNCTRIYFDNRDLREISFSKFNKELEKTSVRKFSRSSLREITEDELFYVNQIIKKSTAANNG